MWNDEVPLFLTGGLAGLRLGPGAGNLAGARQGAERIAWKVDELLSDYQDQLPATGLEMAPGASVDARNDKDRGRRTRLSMEQERSEFTGGFSNQFQALAMAEG